MKTIPYITGATLVFFVAMTLHAAEPGTNRVHRSCCCQTMTVEKPAFPGKSIYQLETSWTRDDGKKVQLASLQGRPQIVAMFFANCQYACPLLVYQMKQLEAALPAGLRTNVGFTLVSFDSAHDTPAVLKNYRVQHGLESRRWTLLNGDPDAVLELSAVLGVQFKETAPGQFSHSNQITLLNAQGEIVWQQAGLGGENAGLIQQIEKLQRH